MVHLIIFSDFMLNWQKILQVQQPNQDASRTWYVFTSTAHMIEMC